MKISRPVGILSYGASIPQQAILASMIEAAQGKPNSGIPQSLGVTQKTVPAIDEDTTTLATAAGVQALQRLADQSSDRSSAQNSIQKIGALFIGSESHPYAVKPTGTMVKTALGLSEKMALADLQFACKAGTQAMQIISAYVAAEMISAGMAIGADTAQSRPGDVLEFTAGAGAAAFILGSQKESLLARLLATVSVATDTPDFWRRPGQAYPEHAGRFSGEPGYFYHVTTATRLLLEETQLKPTDIDYCVFHTPNAKFPQQVAKKLGFTPAQLEKSLVVPQIGNTYAAASLLGLAATLDQTEAGKKILVTSYGSGAGADSFLFETTELLVERRKSWKQFLRQQIAALELVDYQSYRLATGNGHQ